MDPRSNNLGGRAQDPQVKDARESALGPNDARNDAREFPNTPEEVLYTHNRVVRTTDKVLEAARSMG